MKTKRSLTKDSRIAGKKSLSCKCGTLVHNVGDDAVEVKCWRCVLRVVPDPSLLEPTKNKFPRDWQFMDEYVHSDGTVYHMGVEQPDLKGTMDPTDIKTVAKQKKSGDIKKRRLPRKKKTRA